MLRLVLVKEVYFKMNDDLSMIYDILNEIALYLKDDTDNPVSMSLVLHNYGIHDGVVKGKVILAAAKVINSVENTADLTLMDFQRAFNVEVSDKFSIEPGEGQDVLYILKWLSLHQMPDLYPIVMNLAD